MKKISDLIDYRQRSGFDKTSLERLELLFRKTVGNEKEIRRGDFKKIITSKNVSVLHLKFYLSIYYFLLIYFNVFF